MVTTSLLFRTYNRLCLPQGSSIWAIGLQRSVSVRTVALSCVDPERAEQAAEMSFTAAVWTFLLSSWSSCPSTSINLLVAAVMPPALPSSMRSPATRWHTCRRTLTSLSLVATVVMEFRAHDKSWLSKALQAQGSSLLPPSFGAFLHLQEPARTKLLAMASKQPQAAFRVVAARAAAQLVRMLGGAIARSGTVPEPHAAWRTAAIFLLVFTDPVLALLPSLLVTKCASSVPRALQAAASLISSLSMYCTSCMIA